MSSFLASLPALAASILAMAYPLPFGQPVEPGGRISPEGEIVDIDEDRARSRTSWRWSAKIPPC